MGLHNHITHKLFCLLIAGCLLLLLGKLHAQPPNWDSVYADYFIKYQPVDTPAWLFPICFKEYTGDWDTVYFGHDENATWGFDTLMGEKLQLVDTSKFNAHFYGGPPFDSSSTIGKVIIFQLNSFQGISIKFIKGRMPLTMYWDNRAFYSDSLPFPDLGDSLPRARGELWCSDGNPFYDNCPDNNPINLSDSTFTGGGAFSPLRIDSMYFDGNGMGQLYSVLLYIVPFDQPDFIPGVEPMPVFKVFPNPVHNRLMINTTMKTRFVVTLVNVLGQIMFGPTAMYEDHYAIDTENIPVGVYFLHIDMDGYSFNRKILRL